MEKLKLDWFHYHEALDRTYLINSMIEDYLSSHPVYLQNKTLLNNLEKASELLAENYQIIGTLDEINK
jgi:hypothetical protein